MLCCSLFFACTLSYCTVSELCCFDFLALCLSFADLLWAQSSDLDRSRAEVSAQARPPRGPLRDLGSGSGCKSCLIPGSVPFAMAPSSGGCGCPFRRDMTRRFAIMEIALSQECGGLSTKAPVVTTTWHATLGGRMPLASASEWVQVDASVAKQFHEILFGSRGDPGLLAILARRRALQEEQEAKWLRVFQHGFRLGMPVTNWWLPGQPFGVVPEEALSCASDGQIPPVGVDVAAGATYMLPKQRPLTTLEDPILRTSKRGRSSSRTARTPPCAWRTSRRRALPLHGPLQMIAATSSKTQVLWPLLRTLARRTLSSSIQLL